MWHWLSEMFGFRRSEQPPEDERQLKGNEIRELAHETRRTHRRISAIRDEARLAEQRLRR